MKEKKICSRCKIEKKSDEFYHLKPKNKKPCLASACKKCDIERVTKNYSLEICRERRKNYLKNNPQRHIDRLRYDRIKSRLEALRHYGGERPCCKCCGEDKYEFLMLDHINDNGHEQRKLAGGGSVALNKWLKRNKWPTGIEVSCHNCNLAREFYGICPHKVKDYKNVITVECAFARTNPKRQRFSPCFD